MCKNCAVFFEVREFSPKNMGYKPKLVNFLRNLWILRRSRAQKDRWKNNYTSAINSSAITRREAYKLNRPYVIFPLRRGYKSHAPLPLSPIIHYQKNNITARQTRRYVCAGDTSARPNSHTSYILFQIENPSNLITFFYFI